MCRDEEDYSEPEPEDLPEYTTMFDAIPVWSDEGLEGEYSTPLERSPDTTLDYEQPRGYAPEPVPGTFEAFRAESKQPADGSWFRGSPQQPK